MTLDTLNKYLAPLGWAVERHETAGDVYYSLLGQRRELLDNTHYHGPEDLVITYLTARLTSVFAAAQEDRP